jgi:NADPH:quinone reductase-like Zn-dependent oxidoreductase
MRAVLVEKAGGEYTLVDTVEKPSPGKNQILVKSLVTGLNPV